MSMMKPTRKLLFVLCPMLVLGFIYYSAGKLHLHMWGQKTLYDKQGFLLKLDGKLPQELLYKYGNMSKGTCKPGYASAKMASIYPKFAKLAPMFLDQNFRRLGKIRDYLPPFGIKTQEKLIADILAATKKYGLGPHLDSLSCKRCIIVGNGGVLANKSLGSRIDDYHVVVRLNGGPSERLREGRGLQDHHAHHVSRGGPSRSCSSTRKTLSLFYLLSSP
ncbi:ST3 beta-galactoside alpha-2,3-sialyltransferase 3b isoform X2 [Brienomyrus brachyistius]|uniref:ST3 beta-galactoside alpha-2,3-sialyltransferase 3b isoform X2 n=1 Tax=Brienomyrus brachyistius TaxID=42636 RepID=UPI0020B1C463|nr:ST3 beta-galactoside alpha-2,3-sialyltransferase 3b isoform X2 [Brienomyrus brachyistius]